MAKVKSVDYLGGKRLMSITGDSGAVFHLTIKNNAGKTYNWDDEVFTAPHTELRDQNIGNSGKYDNYFIIPTVTSDDRYDVYLTTNQDVVLSGGIPSTIKTFSIFQYGPKTLTFNTTTAISGVAVQNSGSAGTDLVGGTISGPGDLLLEKASTMTQTGTITKSGPTFVYVSSAPTWDKATGGSFTNVNTVEATLVSRQGTTWTLDDGTNVAATHRITGENIIDDITVSSISGNRIVVSADQPVPNGTILTFSKGGWEVSNANVSFDSGTSGTNTVTMTVTAGVEKIGNADVTSVLDIDNFMSNKPNAFPVENVKCPITSDFTAEPVTIDLAEDCTNYLGGLGDNDSNQATKTYKIHSLAVVVESVITATDTAVGVLRNEAGDVLSADDNVGSAPASIVVWTPPTGDELAAGDTVKFYYKTVDAQSSPVTSSTTQGLVSITMIA